MSARRIGGGVGLGGHVSSFLPVVQTLMLHTPQ